MILPIVVQRLFYRYHAELLDTNRDAAIIIPTVLSDGTLDDWDEYGWEFLRDWIAVAEHRKCSPHRWNDFGRGCCWQCRRKRRGGLTATHGGAFPKTLSQTGFRRICEPADPADDTRDTICTGPYHDHSASPLNSCQATVGGNPQTCAKRGMPKFYGASGFAVLVPACRLWASQPTCLSG